MITSGINLVMAIVGFSLSIMFITFVCIRLICARIRMNASRRSGSDLTTLERGFGGLEHCSLTKCPTKKFRELCLSSTFLERRFGGLEHCSLTKCPTKKFRELCLSSKENSRCTICLFDYHEEDTLRFLPVCGHSFHVKCIDIWLQQHFTCPVCRISLRDPPERNRFPQMMFCTAIRSQSASMHYCHCNATSDRHTSTSHDNRQTQEGEGDD